MIYLAKYAGGSGRLMWLIISAALGFAGSARAALDDTFDVLQIGTQVYSNVTVTTKAKTYVMILHSAGMASLKVSELPPEVSEQLGYAPPEKPKSKAETASNWAKDKLGEVNIEKVNAAELKAKEEWAQRSNQVAETVLKLDQKLCGAILAVLVLLYVFYCRCTAEICRKVGKPAGILAWLPGFQIFPLLTAANMSRWWVLAYLIPPIGLLVRIVRCFRLANARGKSALTGFLLILPPISLFAFAYLAFSEGGEERSERRSDPLMTLETA